jgi:hypothetical protein
MATGNESDKKYGNGEGVQQDMGINITGHSFQQSSASWLADSGTDKDTIMRHESSTLVEGYVETSEWNKKYMAGQIVGENVGNPPAKVARIEQKLQLLC